MAQDVAVQKAPSKEPSDHQRSEQEPTTVEVEIKGRKVQAQMQTVQTGAGSITRLVNSFLHRV